MTRRVEIAAAAKIELDGLDPGAAKRVVDFMNDQVATLTDPRSIAKALRTSEWGQFWKYRVDGYRIIVEIEEPVLRILIVRAEERRRVLR